MSMFQRMQKKLSYLTSYFCSVFTSEDSLSLPSFSIPSTICPIDAINISVRAVHLKLTNINVSKSPGPDGWAPIVLKEVADSICLPMYLIFTVPSSWKRGCVTPIFKRGERNILQNYQLITLTSMVGKILESLVRVPYLITLIATLY